MPQSSLLSSRERGAGPCIKKKKLAAAISFLISIRTSFSECQPENTTLESFGAELIQKWKNTKHSVPFVTLDSGVLAVSCAVPAYSL